MPATVEALAVVVLAVVPGALYTWALEREAGRWGIGLADRALRFVGMSVVLHAVLLYGWYELWRCVGPRLVAHGHRQATEARIDGERLAHGRSVTA